jgi:hypothetical protein
VKARYFYGLDNRDWDLWRTKVWSPDGRLEVPEVNVCIEPLEEIIAWVSRSMADQVFVHHGHTPIISFTSDATASVIWAMEDRLYGTSERPTSGGRIYLHGVGHYHEAYARIDAGWRLRTSRITRLHVRTDHVS